MAKAKLISSMLIFSTIGIFVKNIALPSSLLALTRGAIGTIFLLLLTTLSGKPLSRTAIRKNIVVLAASGAAIGINWILLFEAYRHTTIAIATLSYYLAPVFVMLLSPIVIKEPLTVKKTICIITALSGMVLVSGVLQGGSSINLTGVMCGIGAAAFYASVILLNKFLKQIHSHEATIIQLAVAALILVPYVFGFENLAGLEVSVKTLALLLIVGIIHTGLAYWMYFSSMADLPGQTIAIFSYIDPAAAVLLSLFLLKEPLDGAGLIGALLILGAAFCSELNINIKTRNKGRRKTRDKKQQTF